MKQDSSFKIRFACHLYFDRLAYQQGQFEQVFSVSLVVLDQVAPHLVYEALRLLLEVMLVEPH